MEKSGETLRTGEKDLGGRGGERHEHKLDLRDELGRDGGSGLTGPLSLDPADGLLHGFGRVACKSAAYLWHVFLLEEPCDGTAGGLMILRLGELPQRGHTHSSARVSSERLDGGRSPPNGGAERERSACVRSHNGLGIALQVREAIVGHGERVREKSRDAG